VEAEDIYRRLIDGAQDSDPFDAHVIASICALGFVEAQTDGGTIVDCVGLERAELGRLFSRFFPQAAELFLKDGDVPLQRLPEELSLIDLLQRCGTIGSSFEAVLAGMIARRAQRPHHLWQDLGFRNRGELSTLMQRHFAPLAARNSKDMKWKKFLYRTICTSTGYSLCTAPSCSECDDFASCFEEESGESLLAQLRFAADAA
jgi:nitrogen fixation protein NifQ